MAAIQFNSGVSLNITPLFNKTNFKFRKFECEEAIQGYLPTIQLSVDTMDTLTLINDEHEMTISSPACTLKSKVYVYSLQYEKGIMLIKFLPCDGKFVREVHTATFVNIDTVLTTLYPGEIGRAHV